MFLRNFDYATKYLDYLSMREFECISLVPIINGWYAVIAGVRYALLVVDAELYFLDGSRKVLVKDVHHVLVTELSEFETACTVFDGDDILTSFLYASPNPELNIAPFEYIDEDDFNWGLFLAKIINDSARKRNFVENLMK